MRQLHLREFKAHGQGHSGSRAGHQALLTTRRSYPRGSQGRWSLAAPFLLPRHRWPWNGCGRLNSRPFKGFCGLIFSNSTYRLYSDFIHWNLTCRLCNFSGTGSHPRPPAVFLGVVSLQPSSIGGRLSSSLSFDAQSFKRSFYLLWKGWCSSLHKQLFLFQWKVSKYFWVGAWCLTVNRTL